MAGIAGRLGAGVYIVLGGPPGIEHLPFALLGSVLPGLDMGAGGHRGGPGRVSMRWDDFMYPSLSAQTRQAARRSTLLAQAGLLGPGGLISSRWPREKTVEVLLFILLFLFARRLHCTQRLDSRQAVTGRFHARTARGAPACSACGRDEVPPLSTAC